MYETRKQKIINLINKNGTITTIELKSILGVSEMTVRRDITAMAKESLLKRVYGGAVALNSEYEDKSFIDSFVKRQVVEARKKQAIARRALPFLIDGEAIYIDGSTTCSELTKLIPTINKNIQVVTNSMNVLVQLHNITNIELVFLGGVLDKDGNTFDGILTVENAQKIMVDYCFFSAKGFSIDCINNGVMIGSQVKQLMIKQARMRILLADSTKFGKIGLFKLCGWSDVDVLISDDALIESELETIKKQNTDIHLAKLSDLNTLNPFAYHASEL